MGVRYNAEKKKIGNYYSTPIYSFRCKCHLCSGWFEIQTDPKNTRYVVTSGARQKDEDWNPEDNGGFAIHDTEDKEKPVDPLVALEKSTESQDYLMKVQAPRLQEIQDMSDRHNEDPYAASVRARKKLREEKKVEKAKEAVDKAIKSRYGLPTELKLLEDGSSEVDEAKREWLKARRESMHARRTKVDSISSLRANVLANTAKRKR